MTTGIMDEIHNGTLEKPGMQLARVRKEKTSYSLEQVAGTLHLRVRIIELLEADDYEQMPEPVFIQGYLRAYAKLLGVPADPLIELFNKIHSPERKVEKALWQQGRREPNKGERAVRLLTGLITVGAIVAVGIWWQKNKENPYFFPEKDAQVLAEVVPNKPESEIRLTDLSKMRSMLRPNNNQITPMENHGG